MTVTYISAKVTDVTKIDSETIIPAPVVDMYGALNAELTDKKSNIAPLSTEVAEMAKGIIGSVDEVIDPGTPMVLNGNEYRISLGAQGVKLVAADNEAVIDELGLELFMKLAKVSTTDLKSYCTPEQLEKITTSTFSIKRRIKVEAL